MTNTMSKITKAAALLLFAAVPLSAQNLVNGSDFPIAPPISGVFAPNLGGISGYSSSATKSAVSSLQGVGNPLTVLGGASLSTAAANQVFAIMTGGAGAGAASTEITTALMGGGASSTAVAEFLTAMAKTYKSNGFVSRSGTLNAVKAFNALIASITDVAVLNNPPPALLGFHAVLTAFVTAGSK